jgi:hypothetical protein
VTTQAPQNRTYDAPLGEAEVETFAREMRARLNDSALDVRWNPESYITRPGAFDAYGRPIPPSREGRWEVIRHSNEGDLLVWQVKHEGSEAFRPLGPDVIEYLWRWDRANVAWMAEQKRLFDAQEAAEATADALEESTRTEFLERQAVEQLGMKRWIGRGFGDRR